MSTGKKHTGIAYAGIVAFAAAVAVAASPAQAAGLLVADGGLGGVLEMKEHTVHVTINNGIAVTEVNQVFVNTEQRQVEALYTFPVPANASVANFSMWIGGKEMIGEVLEKERAREIYDSYKRQRRDPGLLEQTDHKTFEMRIFPIGPHAEQRVQIAYYQELNHDNDWATYVYPLATTTRKGIDERITGKFALTMEVKSLAPIVEMDSPSHQDEFVFAEHGTSFYEASLEKTEGSLARDVVLAYHLSRPRTGIDVIASRQGAEDGFFCMTMTAGEELGAAMQGMDYVFVLDISGSMGTERKLETSSNAVAAFIEALSPEDCFEVMTFNVQPEVLFGGLKQVTGEAQAGAKAFLGTRQAKGGTKLEPALGGAYQYLDAGGDRILNVVVLSDGLTEQGDRGKLLQLIQARPANVRVFCVGVGNEVNRPLLEQMAEEAGGLAAVISRSDDFARQAQAFRRKLTRPAATNVKIGFPGADVYDIVPEQSPNLYHGMPIRIYGRYRGAGPVKVHVSADLSGYALDDTMEFDFPAEDKTNPEIERMWAWHKIQRLQKNADRTGSRDAVKNEIVMLGEAYSIVSEYTSFLVLENNAEYKRWKIDQRNAVRIERDRTAQRQLRKELDAMRLASLDALLPQDLSPTPEERQNRTTVARNTPARPVHPHPAATPTRHYEAPRRSRSFRIGGGGGAIDPVSGGIAASLIALAVGARRKSKKQG